ncbi:hypothetical protein D9756_008812 [Leucocoprinus leucothites]|uniref:Uracil-DNA glycosylase-like domain-containing protein n=1 Tax=Leucocoprinus leucothites TaxID=201217 RepID=A0A8H5CY23_9AGAR|nr:hypothetical protein D9756_008812 [Leucoagaricus leucothites]
MWRYIHMEFELHTVYYVLELSPPNLIVDSGLKGTYYNDPDFDTMLEDDESAPAESSLRLREKISAFSFQNSEPTTPWRSPRKAKSRETPPLGRTPSTKLRSLTTKRGFAPPEKYSHLNALQDYLEENLDRQNSAEIGHHFGGPTNHFWPCLYESGLTTERLQPTQDHTLPSRFSIGMTNLVDRPTAEQYQLELMHIVQQNELSRAEQLASVPSLLSKISKYKPKIVCFVGLGISQVVRAYILPVSNAIFTLSCQKKINTMLRNRPSRRKAISSQDTAYNLLKYAMYLGPGGEVPGEPTATSVVACPADLKVHKEDAQGRTIQRA